MRFFQTDQNAYLACRMVTDHRIKLGVDMMKKHRPLLQEVSSKYGVPESVIVAIWGMESR
jgi:membrane-bound lytic murein transglycosylase B